MADETNPGMMGALSSIAYGDGPSPAGMMSGVLDKLMPSEEDNKKNNDQAWWGNFSSGPAGGGLGRSLANANKGQADYSLEQQKLKAQYLPMIMQAMVGSQQMSLAASKQSREYLEKINPAIDNHLASLTVGGNEPTYQDAVAKIIEFGRNNQVPSQVLMDRVKSVPQDQAQLGRYLSGLTAANSPADKLLPTAGTNASGQNVSISAVKGTVKPMNGQGSEGGNPTTADAKFDETGRGDVKSYEEGLRARSDAYEGMLARMNKQAEYVKKFQSGRYAGVAGGLSAAIQDIGARLPGIDKTTVTELAQRLVGAPPGSKDALAAQQLFEQLSQQEVLAQLRSSLGDGQRMNLAEVKAFQNANLGTKMDPETFAGMRKFFYNQAAEAGNKYNAWGDYMSHPDTKKPSVTGFDAPWSRKRMEHLLSGSTEPMGLDKPSNMRPTYDTTQTQPAQAPAQQAPQPSAQRIDLSMYEPGAKLGPTGKVYIIDKDGVRAARKVGDSPEGMNRISNREVTGRVQ